jgi:hypothetical protein
MDQMGATMRLWRISKAKTMTQTTTAVGVVVQGREQLGVTYEKRVMKPEKGVQTAGERRYCARIVGCVKPASRSS